MLEKTGPSRSFLTGAVVFLLLSGMLPVHGLMAFEETVFDPQAFQQQLINYMLQTKQYANQMQQLQNQYSNMQNLGYKADLSNLNEMQRVMNSAVGISNDYTKMQRQFQTLYPDFATYRGQKGVDYARQSAQWSQNTQQNAEDMLTVSSKLQESIGRDQQNLTYLNNRSDSAAGIKDLLQTMNQLLVLQTKQLFQLQQLIATSAKADAAYLAEQSSNNEASRAQSDNIYRGWTDKGERTPARRLWDEH